MELKTYLRILLNKWWIIVPTFLLTFTSGVVFTYTRTPVYSATTTYLVLPGSTFGEGNSFAVGLDMLGRREEIAATFAEIATSRSIKLLTFQARSMEWNRDYSFNSELRRGTSVLEFTVSGPDPTIARDLANSLGTTVEDYIQERYEVFTLLPLDEATTPINPISPKIVNNLVLAVILGLALGGGLAFLANYLETSTETEFSLNIIDHETGVFTQEYFVQRLSKEMIRAKRNRYPLSLALLRVDNFSTLKGGRTAKVRLELLHKVAALVSQHLREEDVVGYFGHGVFALLLPDMTGENSKSLMEYLQTRVAWTPFESTTGVKLNLKSIVGVVAYNHNGASRDEFVAQANKALQRAEVEDNGKAFLITDPVPVGETHA